MTTPAERRALLVVDVQNDFCEGGSLAVVGGQSTAQNIRQYLNDHSDEYVAIVATRDHHVDPGSHFSQTPDFADSWPAHCVVGTKGANLHDALSDYPFDAMFDKGERAAAYSGFEGVTSSGESLDRWLREHAVTDVDVVGIATDYCVRATALDSQMLGFATRVLVDYTSGVAEESTELAIAEMSRCGVTVAGGFSETAIAP